MDFGLDTVVPTASTQVANLIMAQVQVMPTIVLISFSHGKKPEKLNGINFKRLQ